MAFDLQGALRAGHSEEDVAKYLAEKTGFDIDGALNAGYDTSAVVDYTLNKLNAAAPAPAPAAPLSPPPADAEMQQLIERARGSISEGSSGFLRESLDVPVQVAKGAATGVRFISDVFGADNPLSQQISGIEDYLDGLLSAQAKQDQQEVSRIMQEAEDKGLGEQIRAGLKAFTVAPIDFVSNAFGTSVPVLAAGLLVPASAAAGTAAAVATGVGVLTGVGITKDAAYTAVYDELISSGVAEEDARSAAKEAQAYSGENIDNVALGGFLGGLASRFGLEGAVFGANVATKLATPSMARTVASTAVKEAIPEGMQGGQEQFTRNIALQREGFDVPTSRGVATAATLEGTVGAPVGAIAGYGRARQDAAETEDRDEFNAPFSEEVETGTAPLPDEEKIKLVGEAGLTAEEQDALDNWIALGRRGLTTEEGTEEEFLRMAEEAEKRGDDEAADLYRGQAAVAKSNAEEFRKRALAAEDIYGDEKYVGDQPLSPEEQEDARDELRASNVSEEELSERLVITNNARGIMNRLGREEAQAQEAVEQAKKENADAAIVKASEDNLAFIRGKLFVFSEAGVIAGTETTDASRKLAKEADKEQVVAAYNQAAKDMPSFNTEERETVKNLKAKKLRGAPEKDKPFTEEEAARDFFRRAEITENPEMALREIAYEIATDPEVTMAEMESREATPAKEFLSQAVGEFTGRWAETGVKRGTATRTALNKEDAAKAAAWVRRSNLSPKTKQTLQKLITEFKETYQAGVLSRAIELRRKKSKPLGKRPLTKDPKREGDPTRPAVESVLVPVEPPSGLNAAQQMEKDATDTVKKEMGVKRPAGLRGKRAEEFKNKVKAEIKKRSTEAEAKFESITPEQIEKDVEDFTARGNVQPSDIKPKYSGKDIDPEVVAIAETGNLKLTVNRLIDKEPREVQWILRRLLSMATNTKIRIGPVPVDAPIPGMYNGTTNEITLDPERGLNTATLFHELGHAGLARRLNDPNSKEAKVFFDFFSTIKDQMGDAYGGQDLDEFVSELLSNREFVALLKEIKAPRSGSMFQNIMDAILEFFNIRKGQSAYEASLEFIQDIITLSPEVEPPPLARIFYANENPDTVLKEVIKETPPFNKNKWAKTMDRMRDGRKSLSAGFKFLRMDNFVELYGKALPGIAKIIKWQEQRQGYQEKRITKSQLTYRVLLALKKRLPVQMQTLGKLALDIREAEVDILSDNDTKVETPVGNPTFIARYKQQRAAAGLPAPTQADIDKKLAAIKEYQAKFNKLDKDVQQAYKTMRVDYDEMFKEFKDFTLGAIADVDLRKKMEQDFIINEPVAGYVPQRRFGDFIVQFTGADGRYTVETFETTSDRTAFLQWAGLTESLGVNPDTGDQQQLDPKNTNQYIVTNNVRETVNSAGPPPGSFLADLFSNIDKEALAEQATLSDPADIQAVKDAAEAQKQVIYETYLDLFPENSLVRSFRKSKNIPGASEDLPRVYGDTMVRLARKMSNTLYNEKIREAFKEVAKDAAKYERGLGAKEFNPLDIQAVANEIVSRQAFVINPEYSSPIRLLSMGSFTLFLAGNVSSALINLTSIPLLGQPLLNRDFAGREIPALTTAMKMAVNSNWGTRDKEAGSRYDYKGLYDFLMDHAALKHTMVREIMEGGRQSSAEFNTLGAKVMNLLSLPFSATEEYNRATIGIAAYKLAIDNPQMVPKEYRSEEGAKEYALRLVKDVNTSGMAATGPRLMQGDFAGGIGRATFTFKSFIWQSAFVTARAFVQSIKGETAEVRRAAFRQFMLINGMSFAIAGVFGMPFFGALATLANMVGALINALDDEEEEPFNTRRELMLALPEWATKGPTNYWTNIEMSNRASVANGLLFREDPYEIEKFGYVGAAMMQAFGPMGNFVQNVPYGMRLISQGDLSKGVEQMVPSFLRNGFKTFRYLDEGLVTNDGISIADDLTGWMLAKQFLGFSPAHLSSIYETRALAKQYEQKVMRRRSALLKSRFMAITSGDRELLRETNQRLRQFRRIYPRLINSRTYESSFKSRQASQREYTYGLRFNKNFRGNLDAYFDRLETTL